MDVGDVWLGFCVSLVRVLAKVDVQLRLRGRDDHETEK